MESEIRRTAFSAHEDIYVHHLKTDKKHNMSVQHYHDGYEIYLQLKGERYLFYDNIYYTLKRGSVVIFKPFDIHYAQSRDCEYYERYVLNFREEQLGTLLNDSERHFLLDKIKGKVLYLDENQLLQLQSCFQKAELAISRKGFLANRLIESAVIELLITLADASESNTSVVHKQIEGGIVAGLKYISENYKLEIALDDVANAAKMSKFNFCRKFRIATGATVLEYITNLRLTRVHNLLINTEMSIDEIANASGFSSATNLTRAFKKVYGLAPREFRKLK